MTKPIKFMLKMLLITQSENVYSNMERNPIIPPLKINFKHHLCYKITLIYLKFRKLNYIFHLTKEIPSPKWISK